MMCKMDGYEAVNVEEEPVIGKKHRMIGICLSHNE